VLLGKKLCVTHGSRPNPRSDRENTAQRKPGGQESAEETSAVSLPEHELANDTQAEPCNQGTVA